MSVNILGYEGYLKPEDRKKPLEHGCDHFTFKTNLDLSEPIKVIPYGTRKEFTVDEYSRDVASFFVWWNYFVWKGLNGFSGMSNLKFELVGFKII